jgi:hypothetical protein
MKDPGFTLENVKNISTAGAGGQRPRSWLIYAWLQARWSGLVLAALAGPVGWLVWAG